MTNAFKTLFQKHPMKVGKNKKKEILESVE